MTNRFDVFLSHNSKDKPAIRELAEALHARGLTVWLDEWELVPGHPWQEALEEIIETASSSAVLVGKDGLGPWQDAEMRGCLSEFVDRKLPVIPVLLPGAPEAPKLPLFLKRFTWVDLRGGLTEEGLDRLQWGITGRRPDPSKPLSPPIMAPNGAGTTKPALSEAQPAAAEVKPAPPAVEAPAAGVQEHPAEKALTLRIVLRELSDLLRPLPRDEQERRKEARERGKLRGLREPVIGGWKKAGWGAGMVAIAVLVVFAIPKLLKLELELERLWSEYTQASLLTSIYEDTAPRRVREEKVKAYILFQRDHKRQVMLREADLAGMDLGDQHLKGADFSRCRMQRVLFDLSSLQEAVFREADLTHSSFRYADLSGADFSGARLTLTDLSGSNLVKVDFRGADFAQRDEGAGEFIGRVYARGASFSGAMFDRHTKFCQIDLSGAKLSEAIGLIQDHLSCAILDKSTTLPKGLRPPNAGECSCINDPLEK